MSLSALVAGESWNAPACKARIREGTRILLLTRLLARSHFFLLSIDSAANWHPGASCRNRSDHFTRQFCARGGRCKYLFAGIES